MADDVLLLELLGGAEYEDWMDKYNTRKLLDQDALEEHIRHLKRTRSKEGGAQ